MKPNSFLSQEPFLDAQEKAAQKEQAHRLFFCFLLIFSSLFLAENAKALALVLERDAPEGRIQTSIERRGQSLLLVTNSNLFQPNILGLGKFKRQAMPQDQQLFEMIRQIQLREKSKIKSRELKQTAQLKQIRETLGPPKHDHQTFIRIDNIEVRKSSASYERLMRLIYRLLDSSPSAWQCLDCLEVSLTEKTWRYRTRESLGATTRQDKTLGKKPQPQGHKTTAWILMPQRDCYKSQLSLHCRFSEFGHLRLPIP